MTDDLRGEFGCRRPDGRAAPGHTNYLFGDHQPDTGLLNRVGRVAGAVVPNVETAVPDDLAEVTAAEGSAADSAAAGWGGL